MLGDYLKLMLPDLMKLKSGILTDLHEVRNISYIHLDLIIPLINTWQKDTTVFGCLALRIDPEEILYPLVKDWPVPSKSAEALLVRQEGEEVLYLNDLRFKMNSRLVLRKSLSEEKLPEAMAVRGVEATIDGIDYRGASISAMKKVPGSQWYLTAKINHSEVFSALNEQMTMIIIIIILCYSGNRIIAWYNRMERECQVLPREI